MGRTEGEVTVPRKVEYIESYIKYDDGYQFLGATRLIRCKDCRYYEVYERKYDGSADKRFKPSICTRAYEYAVAKAPNWFCADAEPKEGN